MWMKSLSTMDEFSPVAQHLFTRIIYTKKRWSLVVVIVSGFLMLTNKWMFRTKRHG